MSHHPIKFPRSTVSRSDREKPLKKILKFIFCKYYILLTLCLYCLIIVYFFYLAGMQNLSCSEGAMGMGHMGGMGGYGQMSQLRSPVHSQAMLLPGHPHAMMMAHGPMGHPGLPPQGSPYDASGGHIMDIHAS